MSDLRKYGLIGASLVHSFSPGYFKRKFEREHIDYAEYKAYELESIQEFPALIEKGVDGLNVTIPYKKEVIPFLDALHVSALEAGAANVIKSVNGKLIGYNTDVFGFAKSLVPFMKSMALRNALILGTGGAAQAVAVAFDKMDVLYEFVSRSGKHLRYTDLDEEKMAHVDIIVNTTPLGLYPEFDVFPAIPYGLLNEEKLVYDLIYNPEKTVFLVKAEAHSAIIKNGMEMLIYQAEKTWQIWQQDIDLETHFEWM